MYDLRLVALREDRRACLFAVAGRPLRKELPSRGK